MVYNLPANVEDTGSSPDLGRSYMPRSNSTHTSQLLSLCSRPQKLQPLKLKSPRAWCFATRDATSVRGLSTAKQRNFREANKILNNRFPNIFLKSLPDLGKNHQFPQGNNRSNQQLSITLASSEAQGKERLENLFI